MRKNGNKLAALASLVLAGVTLAACSSGGDSGGAASSASNSASATGGLQTVSVQLKWFTQGQFAGYIAAKAQGFYAAQGLNVNIINGGPDTVSENAVADGSADFADVWVPDGLAAREKGAKIVDVAQVYQRASMQEYSLKSSGITTPADFKGKNIGVNGAGNDVDVFAGLSKAGVSTSSVNFVQQNGSIEGLFDGDLDAAQGASYNELGQILSTKDQATGKLYTTNDINIIDWSNYGTAMLEDGIWANSGKLASDPAYAKETQEFVTATLQGWIFCRDNLGQCRDDVVKAGSNLGASLQLFQVNGVNQLIWPSPQGIGVMDPTAWNNTVKIAMDTKETTGTPLLASAPAAGGYTNTYADKALKELRAKGLDVTGSSYQPTAVTLNPGGN
jgi:NitT/TauT family transport system substrate-binding protein